jgi:hypothetical protein
MERYAHPVGVGLPVQRLAPPWLVAFDADQVVPERDFTSNSSWSRQDRFSAAQIAQTAATMKGRSAQKTLVPRIDRSGTEISAAVSPMNQTKPSGVSDL